VYPAVFVDILRYIYACIYIIYNLYICMYNMYIYCITIVYNIILNKFSYVQFENNNFKTYNFDKIIVN